MEAIVTNLKLKVISQEDAQNMMDRTSYSRAKEQVRILRDDLDWYKEHLKCQEKFPVVEGSTKLYGEFATEEAKQKKLKEISECIDKYTDRLKIYKTVVKVLSARKKELLANIQGREMTPEQVKEYVDYFCDYDKVGAVVENRWKYAMGHIGSTHTTIRIGKKKEKPFKRLELPDWRPIGYCTCHTNGLPGYMGGDFSYSFAIQSWDDVFKHLSDYDDQTMYIFKHPIQ